MNRPGGPLRTPSQQAELDSLCSKSDERIDRVHHVKASVVEPDTTPRTQNGHISNDTRDAARRTVSRWIAPICRKN
jgi:hypothetical protein